VQRLVTARAQDGVPQPLKPEASSSAPTIAATSRWG
jgi:hypothetical protein